MNILVAEDDHSSRELVYDILHNLGHQVILVADGLAALEYARQNLPDLVILDVNMPLLDGFEVCAALRSDLHTASIPVIMLTAQVDIESRVRGLGVGADDYLVKPFHPRELIARVATRLRAKEEADTLRAQREQIRQTFERFVAHEIVEQLLEAPSRVQLGGAEAVVTVLFADLEGFTRLAELAAPPRLIEVLNAYHTLMVRHIKAHGGTLNKFLGDGVMALYNTPLPQPDHALRAVRTALAIRDALPAFYDTLEPEFRLAVNVGINTGPAIVGIIGTPELMDFTAIGDTVNLASRLQRLSDHSEITVSEATHNLVADHVLATRTGPHVVRGREEAVITYLIEGLR